MTGNWSLHRLSGSLGGFAAQWDSLNASAFGSHPLLDSRFVDALLRHFSRGREWLAIYLTAGRPTAMCIVTPRRAGVWQTFLPSQAQIAPALLNEATLAQSLIAKLPGYIGVLDLLCQDPDYTAPPPGTWLHASVKRHALTISIPLHGSFETYWSTRPKKLVSNLRRYERRASSEFSDVQFRLITSAAEMQEAVARYGALESSGWKGAQGTALSPDNEQGRFYAGLMERYAQSGSAAVFELWFGQTLVASRLLIQGGKTVVFLKTTYAEPYARLAPGRLLLKHVIEQMFCTYAGQTLEFYTDADHELQSWATDSRVISHISLYRNRLAALAHSALQLVRRPYGTRDVAERSPTDQATSSDFMSLDSVQEALTDEAPRRKERSSS